MVYSDRIDAMQQQSSPEIKPENRYAKDWNSYSQMWEQQFGSSYSYLGDEWRDDGTGERNSDNFYFTAYAERFISPDMTVFEVGPGSGRWTVRIAPKVRKMIVLDVAEEMLQRTKARCESLGINNVEYVLANGQDFQPIPDDSIDFFFSYDVFVHIALEDTFPYTKEMLRVLKSGAQGSCNYAINSVHKAWERIEQHNDWYREGKHTLGQFYYFSPEALGRMFEYCGLIVKEQHQEGYLCTCVFQKPTEIRQNFANSQQNWAEKEQLCTHLQRVTNELKQAKIWSVELERGKAWLEEQWKNWQRLAEEREQRLQAQQVWLRELEQGKAWLEEQWKNWQRTAEEQGRYLEDLQSKSLFRILARLGGLPHPFRQR